MTRLVDSNRSTITEKLRQVATEAFYSADRDNLTLKSVRDKVENDLKLEAGTLKREEWKNKSKEIVENIVQDLLVIEEKEQKEHRCESSNTSDSDSSVSPKHVIAVSAKKKLTRKRSPSTTNDVASPIKKRLKAIKPSYHGEPRANDTHGGSSSEQKELSTIKTYNSTKNSCKSKRVGNSLHDHEVELSFVKDISSEEQIRDHNIQRGNCQRGSPIREKTGSVLSSQIQERAIDESRVLDENNEEINLSSNSSFETLNGDKITGSKILSDSEVLPQKGALEVVLSHSTDMHDALMPGNYSSTRQDGNEEDMDSDMSVVIDEAPVEKRRRKKKGQHGEKRESGKVVQTSKKATQRSSLAKNDKILSSEEEMVKKLQSQLRKCGVKTIWHFELKEYGEDTRAKIRHLQKALKDVGMQGRFSEVRAREIKESRELMADLEAVKEGNMKWGLKRSDPDGNGQANNKPTKVTINENNASDVDFEKGGFEGNKNLRKTTSRHKSMPPAVQQPCRRSNALDWLEDEESSDG